MAGEKRWCLVTGGRGFAARHLIEMLIRYDMFAVRIADLAPSLDLELYEKKGIIRDALRSGRAHYVSTDLRNKEQVLRACKGAEVVFHMAAPNSSVNNYGLHHSVNVDGTKLVVDACIELKVKRLIYTSSPSVVFDGVHGILNGDETLLYPSKHNDTYSATKAQGEELVLKSNGINGLLTCCIRPSSIFGPGDTLLVPSLVAAARAGKSKFIIGNGSNLYDFTYVENVAHAHVCAERALASEGSVSEKASGQAYFITNMEPVKFWEFVSLILEGLGYQRPRIRIPAFVMMPIAHLVEFVYKIFGPYGMKVPQLTPSRIRLLSCSRSFNCSKARDRLGYTPIVPLQEGIKRTIESYSHLRAKEKIIKEQSTKVSKYLGGGRVADTLLWKSKKRTFMSFLVLEAVFCNFIAFGSSIVSTASNTLMILSVFLYLHGSLPEKILGLTVEKIPHWSFYISKAKSERIVMSAASSWNHVFHALRRLCKGNDSIIFIKVVFILLTLSFLGSISVQRYFVIGFPITFLAFFLYEKMEQEIDAIVQDILSAASRVISDFEKRIGDPHKIG